jgi:chemotaxis protein histidine kinase CheA
MRPSVKGFLLFKAASQVQAPQPVQPLYKPPEAAGGSAGAAPAPAPFPAGPQSLQAGTDGIVDGAMAAQDAQAAQNDQQKAMQDLQDKSMQASRSAQESESQTQHAKLEAQHQIQVAKQEAQAAKAEAQSVKAQADAASQGALADAENKSRELHMENVRLQHEAKLKDQHHKFLGDQAKATAKATADSMKPHSGAATLVGAHTDRLEQNIKSLQTNMKIATVALFKAASALPAAPKPAAPAPVAPKPVTPAPASPAPQPSPVAAPVAPQPTPTPQAAPQGKPSRSSPQGLQLRRQLLQEQMKGQQIESTNATSLAQTIPDAWKGFINQDPDLYKNQVQETANQTGQPAGVISKGIAGAGDWVNSNITRPLLRDHYQASDAFNNGDIAGGLKSTGSGALKDLGILEAGGGGAGLSGAGRFARFSRGFAGRGLSTAGSAANLLTGGPGDERYQDDYKVGGPDWGAPEPPAAATPNTAAAAPQGDGMELQRLQTIGQLQPDAMTPGRYQDRTRFDSQGLQTIANMGLQMFGPTANPANVYGANPDSVEPSMLARMQQMSPQL